MRFRRPNFSTLVKKNLGFDLQRSTNTEGDDQKKRDDNRQVTKGSIEFQYDEHQLRAIFRRFDSDCDYRLSKQDLQNAFKSLGSCLPSYRALAALRRADENGDGYVETVSDWDQLVQYAYKCGFTVEDD